MQLPSNHSKNIFTYPVTLDPPWDTWKKNPTKFDSSIVGAPDSKPVVTFQFVRQKTGKKKQRFRRESKPLLGIVTLSQEGINFLRPTRYV
ncbi:hypothetical protein SAMN05192553_109139 [Cyclobacterium xiamenense]|uniref:Uncharacterized protein n=1 Tax=Cyclobacterium xiamenense TaxID=1297121 RepID=A0A1H7B7B1_9BACT|nr:hypothetical protein SAMN05192553_109139 [Cyclobacterium xiamenense]